MLCGTSAATIIGDIAGVKEDLIDKPGRPIPSGRISVSHARIYAFIWALLCLIITLLFLPLISFIEISAMELLIFGYHFILKGKGFLGNFAIGLTIVLIFLFGYNSVSIEISTAFVFLFFSILFFFTSLSLVGQCRDVKADSRGGLRTLPTQIGVRSSLLLSVFLLIPAIFTFHSARVFWIFFKHLPNLDDRLF